MGFRKIYILFILISFRALQAQEAVYITFLQDSAAVGETVDLIISTDQDPTKNISEIKLNAIEEIQFFPVSATPTDSIKTEKADVVISSLGLWEDSDQNGILSGEELKWEEIKEEKGAITYTNRLKISFYDVGIYMFDGFPFVFNGNSEKTNRALMKVTFKDYDLQVVDSTGLAPIKNIEREALGIQDFLPYLLYILIPLLLIYLGYRYYKKKSQEGEQSTVEEVIIIPPDVKALTELKDLRQRELWQKGEIKQYQSELSHIIREYLEGRYDIKALESTTSQIIRSINDRTFTQADQDKLKRILQISDLVKFAKAKPEVNIHEEFMDDAVEFVQRTRKSVNTENVEEE